MEQIPGQMTVDECIEVAVTGSDGRPTTAERGVAAGVHGARGERGTPRLLGHETAAPVATRRPTGEWQRREQGVGLTFADVLGTQLGGKIEATFHRMAWAEDEIVKACERHGEEPDEQGPIWQSFMLLRPVVQMPNEQVYRSHCRELLERVAGGKDTRPATDAEMLMTLSEFSLNRDLNGSGVGLMIRLFNRVMGDVPSADDLIGTVATEQEIDELEQRLLRKLTQEWRTDGCKSDSADQASR